MIPWAKLETTWDANSKNKARLFSMLRGGKATFSLKSISVRFILFAGRYSLFTCCVNFQTWILGQKRH